MNFNKELLEKVNDSYKAKIQTMDKKEKQYLTGKDTMRGKMLGFLTRDYYQRTKLFLSGDLIYGYTFKVFQDSFDDKKPIPTWVIFSPEKVFLDDPLLYLSIADGFQKIDKNEKVKSKEQRMFRIALFENYNEPKYLEVPPPYNCGHLIYLSIVYLRSDQIPNFHLGINVLVSLQSTSKEVCYLPSKYWDEDYKKLYHQEQENVEKKEVEI